MVSVRDLPANSVTTFERNLTKLAEETAKRIVAELGNLPLALDQAGKYIFAQDISLRAYLQAFNANVKRVLSKRNQACGFQNRHDPVFKTFETSFVKIEKIDPVSAKILVLCSFYENEDVPPEIFVSSTNGQGKPQSLL